MMDCPESYVSEHKNDSFEQLIEERRRLVDEIEQLEMIVYEKDKTKEEWMICPGPDVQYQCDLEYLSELCSFMNEKYNSEIVWGDDFEEDFE